MGRAGITISGDRFDGERVHAWTIEDASVLDFEKVFHQLDADVRTIVEVRRGPGVVPRLVVGGGAGRYVVHAALAHEHDFWTLERREPVRTTEEKIALVVDGRPGRYHPWKVVGEQQAIAAARVFLETGQLDAAQTWRHRRLSGIGPGR